MRCRTGAAASSAVATAPDQRCTTWCCTASGARSHERLRLVDRHASVAGRRGSAARRANVLRPHSETDEARRQAPQRRKPGQEPHHQRSLHRAAGAERAVDELVLHEDLQPLRQPGGKLTAFLHAIEVLLTPYAHPGGWPSSPEPRRWMELVASRCDNDLLASIEDYRVMTPDVYERDFHLPRGHATSFAGGPLAALRNPDPELTRYETMVPGLYLTGAATFPGAGIWGASGRNGFRTVGAPRRRET